MIGILLMSHGNMAEGMAHSSTLFFGENIPQLKALCLQPADNPEEFDLRIKEAVAEIDDGSGVVAMCDLMGGTPCNRSAYVIAENPRLKVITGMNFTMLLEFLGKRFSLEDISEFDVNELMEVGRNGIVCMNDILAGAQNSNSEEDEY